MDFTDPFHNTEEDIEISGYEPVLGGQLAEKAVWAVSYTHLTLPTSLAV